MNLAKGYIEPSQASTGDRTKIINPLQMSGYTKHSFLALLLVISSLLRDSIRAPQHFAPSGMVVL